MPTDKGLRPDDRDGSEDRWEPSIQLDQEQAIPICELDATPHPRRSTISWCRSAAFSASSRLFDLNGETDRVRKSQKSAIIAVDVRRFGHAINTDQVFGTHRIISVTIVANVRRFCQQINTDEVFGTHNLSGGFDLARQPLPAAVPLRCGEHRIQQTREALIHLALA
jgi:hypothetical protein